MTDLGLLESYSGFMQTFTDIRNGFVHDVTNVNINLKEYLEHNAKIKGDLSKALKENFIELKTSIKELPPLMKQLSVNPKSLIWIVATFLLAEIYFNSKPEKSMGLLTAALLGGYTASKRDK